MGRGRPNINQHPGASIAKALKLQANKTDKNAQSNLSIQAVEEAEREQEFLRKVRSRIETRKGYVRLLGLMGFFIIYVMAILLQQKIEDSFAIESRCLLVSNFPYSYDEGNDSFVLSVIMTNIIGTLPTNGQGGVFNAGNPGGIGMLGTTNDFLT